MKELEDMHFEEVLKWAQSADWDDVTNEQWMAYERACERLAPKYFTKLDFTQLEEFYRKYAGDGIDPWFDAWSDALKNTYPFYDIFERLSRIEKTLGVIMKAIGDQPANINIAQLNRLKGGI